MIKIVKVAQVVDHWILRLKVMSSNLIKNLSPSCFIYKSCSKFLLSLRYYKVSRFESEFAKLQITCELGGGGYSRM